ncbi:MAG: tetratricopeptide repeat protein, partial [Planctomycetota bacterium]
AARELLKVDILYAYPKWSAAAIYEAARCFEELSNPVDARRHFQQVLDEYADTQWAVLATQRLEALSRPGLPGQRPR